MERPARSLRRSGKPKESAKGIALALALAALLVELVALALLVTSIGSLDPAALHRQHISFAAGILGLIFGLFSMVGPFRSPRSPVSRALLLWFLIIARTLGWMTLLLDLASLALLVFDPVSTAEQAAVTLQFVTAFLLVVGTALGGVALADGVQVASSRR